MAETREIVVPGELVGETSQLRPGQNTYQQGTSIYALRLGVKTVRGDRVNVISLSGRYEPNRGDMVIGTIAEVGPSNWYISIGAANDVGMHVNDVPWRVEFGETSKYLAIGDTVLLKIVHVDEMKKAQVSMKDRQCRKLTGGIIFDVAPTKVPRIVGRNGSMIQLIKDATNVRMFVGQNGHVWLDGEPDDVAVALEALRKIEAEAHTTGLTDRMKAWLEERRPSEKRVQRAPEPAEESGEGAPVDERPTERPGRRERDERRARDAPAREVPRRHRGAEGDAEPQFGGGDDRPARREERDMERPPREMHREAPAREMREEPRSRRSGEREAEPQFGRGPARRFEEERPARRMDDERPMRRGPDERPARRFEEERPARREERAPMRDAPPARRMDDDRPPRRDERPARRFEEERPARRMDDERPMRRASDEPRSRRSGEGEAEPQFGRGPAPRRFEEARSGRSREGDAEPQFGGEERRPAPRRFEEEERPRPAPRRFEEEERPRPAPRRFEEEERPRPAPRRFEEARSDRSREGEAESQFGRESPRRAPVESDRPPRAFPTRRDDDEDDSSEDRPAARREGSDREGGSRRRRGGRGRGRGGRGGQE